MRNPRKIELLVGMIASGKSTYARSRAKEGAIVVSHDDLTEMLHCEYRYEQDLRECYRRMEEELARVAIHYGRDVVIDRTHLTVESRARWVEFANTAERSIFGPVKIDAVVFPVITPEVHALRRTEADSRGRSYDDWLRVATHHYGQYRDEPIHLNEGFAGIVVVDGEPTP